MTRIDWGRPAEADPARYNPDRRQPELVSSEGEALRARLAKKATAQPNRIARISIDEVLRKMSARSITKLGTRIEIVRQSGKPDADVFIHDTAVQALVHVEKYGDCTFAAALVNAMPISPRKKKLAAWFSAYSPVIINLEKAKARLVSRDSKSFKPFDLHSAKRNPFFR